MNHSPQRLYLAALAAFFVGVLSGCNEPLDGKIAALAVPTGAAASLDATLRSEVAAVEQQKGLPLQLDSPLGPSDSNAAAVLADCYSDSLHLRLAKVVTALIDPAVEDAARAEFIKKHSLLLQKTTNAVDLPRCRFDVGHEFGFFGRMTYLDDAALAARLMMVSSLHAAAEDDGPAAMGDLLRALRVADWLASVRRVEARVLAGTVRSDALSIAAVLFESGVLRRFEAEQLYAALRSQLADWPSDARMLVGERATVIHAYEAIRAGMIDRLVTLDERRRLQSTGRMTGLETAAPAVIDADQARYLRALQGLISAAELPHYQRLDAIHAALDEINSAPTLFAATLFSQDLSATLHMVAKDRALVEVWTIVLAAVGDLQTPPFRENAVSGDPYRVERSEGRVTVSVDGATAVSLAPVGR